MTDASDLDVLIDGRPVPASRVSYREMGFGRWAPGEPTCGYTMAFPVDALARVLTPLYDGYADDDRRHGQGEDDPVLLGLRAAGWPPLDELGRREPRLLAGFLFEYVGYDAVVALLGGGSAGFDFLVNTIDGVRVVGGRVVLSGRAVRKRYDPPATREGA